MYQDFSSMPPEQEREFVVFEQFTNNNAKKAIQIGGIVAGAYLLLTVIVVMSHDKPKPLIEGRDIADVNTPVPAAAAPAPTPTPTPTPAAPTPTPGAAAPAAGADSAATPPAPPAGATKAPPTALVPK